VREYFSGEVETPDKHFFFPSFTLNPLLGSWGKKNIRLQKTPKLQPTREEGGLE
jgi:hypothetical protein